MKKIIITSCGIVSNELKDKFYNILDKNIEDLNLLYITTAVDGELDDDKSWVDDEYQTILDLGIKKENITEYKLDYELDFNDYDAIYMMGGNTFYLLDIIRKTNVSQKIKEAINNGIIYIGSSAGSEILGNSIEVALPYDDNLVNMTDFTGLKIIDSIIIPHANRKEKFIEECKQKYSVQLILLYDKDGIVIVD